MAGHAAPAGHCKAPSLRTPHTGLREENNRLHPVGLYDLDRKSRPVGEAYRDLIRDGREVLPTPSTAIRPYL